MRTPPQLTAKNNINIQQGDSLIHVKADGTIDIYPYIPSGGGKIGMATLTALAMYWAMMDDEFRIKLCKRAKLRVEDLIAGREADT